MKRQVTLFFRMLEIPAYMTMLPNLLSALGVHLSFISVPFVYKPVSFWKKNISLPFSE